MIPRSRQLRMALVIACVCGGAASLPGAESPATPNRRVTVQADVSSDRTPQNRPVELTLRVEWEGAPGDFEIDEPPLPTCPDLDVTPGARSNESRAHDGRQVTTRLYRYTLTPTKVGLAEVGPIAVTYRETGAEQDQTLQTSAVKIEVVQAVPEGLSAPLRIGLALFAGIGVLTLLFVAVVRSRRNSATDEALETPPELTPAERALAALEAHKSLRLAGEHTRYCQALADTVRDYLGAVFELNPAALSTSQLLAQLADADASAELVEQAAAVLERGDLAKFAGLSPEGAELDELHDQVRTITALPVRLDTAAPGELDEATD